MPWKVEDVPRHNKKLKTRAEKEAWVKIANAVLKNSGDEGIAIAVANARAKKKAERDKKEEFVEQVFYELQINQILGLTIKSRIPINTRMHERALRLSPVLSDVDRFGTVFYITVSGTEGNTIWSQQVKAMELRGEITKWQEGEKTAQEALWDAFNGEVRVRCDCPGFLYWGWQFVAGKNKAISRPFTTRAPKVRNPKQEGAVCKHIYAVLYNFYDEFDSTSKLLRDTFKMHKGKKEKREKRR